MYVDRDQGFFHLQRMIRVLYAEDDQQVAEMVQLYFGRFGTGCSIDIVNTGRGCLQALEQGGYDVLMLDLIMPDLDGLQVLGELTSRCDPTPVIMVSGQGQHELAVRAIRAGAVDCIDKNSPDFRRIPEIVQRVHTRHQRRLGTAAAGPRDHRVLFVDPVEAEGHAARMFFATGAHRLLLTPALPEMLERFLSGELEFDAVVLGPNLETTAMFDALRQRGMKICRSSSSPASIMRTQPSPPSSSALMITCSKEPAVWSSSCSHSTTR